MNKQVPEKRNSVRCDSAFPLRTASGISGETINLNDTGVCFLTEKPVLSSKAKVVIELTSGDVIDTEINIIWSKRNEKNFLYGACFPKTDVKALEALKKALSEVKINSICQPLNDSFIPLSSKLIEGLHPNALSVDITNTCNLRCKHCFWDSYNEQLPESSNPNILDSVKNVLKKFPSITNITWYGGEPLADKKIIKLLKQGVKLKKNNLLITNGTFPIPFLGKNVHVTVSIDGTEKIHNSLRKEGIFNKIRRNIHSAIKRNIPVSLLYCLNAVNIDCVPEFLEEWSTTGIEGIGFTMYTPLKNKPSYLILNDSQKEQIVSLLLDMKKKFDKLIYNTESMIELIKAKYGEELAKNCPMNVFKKYGKTYCLHMCNDGNIRVPCALGKDSSHLYCRSITKLALYAGKVLRDKESFLSLIRMYISTSHTKESRNLQC